MQSYFSITSILVALTALSIVNANHVITINNHCGATITPGFKDSACDYCEPCDRCGQTNPYTGPTSLSVGVGKSGTFTLPDNIVGRVYDTSVGGCNADGSGSCTLFEFDFDVPNNQFTPQSYDISLVEGFNQGIQVIPNPGDAGCEEQTCFDASCPDTQRYPHVSGCSAPGISFTVNFCAA